VGGKLRPGAATQYLSISLCIRREADSNLSEIEATDDRWQISAIFGDASQFFRIEKEHIEENSHTK
jgi:hypothetical protein